MTLRRSLRLLDAFRHEQSDPDRFYSLQASDAVEQSGHYLVLRGMTVLDVGGGGGFFTQAFNSAGARAVLVEPSAGTAHGGSTELSAHADATRPGRLAPGRTIAGDGYRLPVLTSSIDLVFSSNVLEHVSDVPAMVDELVRVARPGGTVFLSFTTWFSYWGGHETAPWHFVGGHRAARRYRRRNGRWPGNRFGESLFARHAGPTLRYLRGRSDVEVVDARPRYHPDWLRWLVAVPVVREFAVWNLLVVLRRRAEDAQVRSGRSTSPV